MPEELSLSQASKLLNWGGHEKPSDRFPNPHREALRVAVETAQSFVVLDGRRYKLSITADKIHIRPEKGFVPCGWLPRKWLYEEMEAE